MRDIIKTVVCTFRCADSRLNVVNEDGLVLRTATEDAAVVWADSHARHATVTVRSLHLNWTRIDIAAKDFADVPQSHALVYSTGDQDRAIGREIEVVNVSSVKRKVNAAKWLLRRAEPLG